jgi:Squalene-hopene cyclase N-terminal domain
MKGRSERNAMKPEDSIDYVLRHQQADGGFPYASAGGSVLEATAFSLMAAQGRDPKNDALKRAAAFLTSLQNKDGGFFLFPGDNLSSAYGTALAVLALKADGAVAHKSRLDEAAFYLRNDHRYVRSTDLDLDVWGWNQYTNIGSEPTAMVVLALKHLGSLPEDRAEQASQFFSHTKCDYGGWSYGAAMDRNDPRSSSPVCTVLPPQLHVTALVMMAMQDRKDEFRDGLKVISELSPGSRCPLSLSLSALAVDCYGEVNLALLDRLNGVMAEDGQVNDKVFYHALAALANLTRAGKNPLRLGG